MRVRCIAVALLFIAAPSFAQDAARMEQVIQTHVRAGTFMGAVLVARGDALILNKAYGSANLEWDTPNSPSTKFRVGSLTKQFTAASILLLEERGLLTVEDPIKKHFTDAPAAWDTITIYNLLTHTSGIQNYTALPDYSTLKRSASSVDSILATVRDSTLDFPPGERMSYSNSGYVLLGAIIETLTGGSYGQFVRDNIFTPLGMKNSGCDSNTAIIPQRASGYTPSATAGFVNADYVHMSIPHAAGALYSTTGDLLKWELGLFGDTLLSAASLQKMTTPPPNNDYAFGVVARADRGRKIIWHNGGIEGFRASMAYYPDTKIAIIVLANVNGDWPTVDELLFQLDSIAHGDRITLTSERKEKAVPATVLARYAGVYAYEQAPGVIMTITLEAGQLMTQQTGQGKLAMFAESDSTFFWKLVDGQIEFVQDASGAVTHLVLHQGGRDFRAVRK